MQKSWSSISNFISACLNTPAVVSKILVRCFLHCINEIMYISMIDADISLHSKLNRSMTSFLKPTLRM